MSIIVPCSIVVLVHRWGIYLTVCTHNESDQFNYIACNEIRSYPDWSVIYCLFSVDYSILPNYDAFSFQTFVYNFTFLVCLAMMLVVTQMTFGCELEIPTMKSYIKKPIGVVTGMIFQYGVLPSV